MEREPCQRSQYSRVASRIPGGNKVLYAGTAISEADGIGRGEGEGGISGCVSMSAVLRCTVHEIRTRFGEAMAVMARARWSGRVSLK
jgi:hypothetical protein